MGNYPVNNLMIMTFGVTRLPSNVNIYLTWYVRRCCYVDKVGTFALLVYCLCSKSRIPVTNNRDMSWDAREIAARSPPCAFNSTLRNLLHESRQSWYLATLHRIFKVVLHSVVTINDAPPYSDKILHQLTFRRSNHVNDIKGNRQFRRLYGRDWLP